MTNINHLEGYTLSQTFGVDQSIVGKVKGVQRFQRTQICYKRASRIINAKMAGCSGKKSLPYFVIVIIQQQHYVNS